MSGVSQKSKSKRVKPPKSRPQGTSTLSQPSVEEAWSSTVLSAFSQDGEFFAFLSLAVDKHRLRVYNVAANQAIAEHIVDRARVTSLAWIQFTTSDDKKASKKKDDSPSKKRKKVDDLQASSAVPKLSPDRVQVVALGLSDGSIQIFSPTHGRLIRTLSHPKSSSAVLAISESNEGYKSQTLWTSSADGGLRLWDLMTGEILNNLQSESSQPYTALSLRPGVENDQAQILAASTTIHLLSGNADPTASDVSDSDVVQEICTFGGHASSVKSLRWDTSISPAKRFFSTAEDDRFVYIWETADLTTRKGKLAASCSQDTDVRQIDILSSPEKQTLLTLSTSGKITISPIPAELSASSASKSSKQQVPALLPRSTITLSSKKKSAPDVRIISASFISSSQNRICVALLGGGAKLGFENLEYLDTSGDFIPELILQSKGSLFEPAKDAIGVGIANHRYSESDTVAVATGEQTPHDPSLDAAVDREVEGALDIDLAELSLGQRLAARSGADVASGLGQRSSGSDAEDPTSTNDAKGTKRSRSEKKEEIVIPAHSLTRTLIQALHSSDAGLLEACLAHSDEALIKNTIARLPPQLAVPLLTACVERLGRGGRGSNLKGRGGGASAQRGMSLIKWIKAVLTIHSSHLLTMPDLVARLSNLHSTLTTRLTLQERLLTLSGRLELVLSQVELRSSSAPAPLTMPGNKNKRKQRNKNKKEPLKYVEGESSDEEEDEQMEVEVEGEDDEGDEDDASVEDVELGGDSDEESDEEEEEDGGDEESGDDDDDDDNEESNLVNGFIDDEAEEDYEEDESEEDSD